MRNRLSKIANVTLTLALMLVTCEVATRLLSRTPRNVMERDPKIGRRFLPEMAEHVYNQEADKGIFFRTNQFGFRGPDVAVPKPADVRRIAVVGDSYTASMALPEDLTFCHHLQRLVNACPGSSSKWEVLNFGIPGSGTGQELALFRNLIRKLDVDILLVAFGNATDVCDNSRELSTNPIIQFRLNSNGSVSQIEQSQTRLKLSNLLNENCRFYSWQKKKLNRLKWKLQNDSRLERGRHLIYARNEPPAYSRAWKLTAAIFETFRHECDEVGARLMVATIPSAYQIYPDHFGELCLQRDESLNLAPMHPDERLKKICDELRIPFCSLTPAFITASPSRSSKYEPEQLFFAGKGHLNAKGSEIAGSLIASWLTETDVAFKSSQERPKTKFASLNKVVNE